jgi:hypothetical protein
MDSLVIKLFAIHEAGHAVVAVALGVPQVKLAFSWQSPEKGVIEKFCAGQEADIFRFTENWIMRPSV